MADAIVAGWLADLDLGSCIATFRDEGIDSEALSCLTDEQLVQLGVRRMGDRSKVILLLLFLLLFLLPLLLFFLLHSLPPTPPPYPHTQTSLSFATRCTRTFVHHAQPSCLLAQHLQAKPRVCPDGPQACEAKTTHAKCIPRVPEFRPRNHAQHSRPGCGHIPQPRGVTSQYTPTSPQLRAKALGSMPGAAPLKQQVATPAPAPAPGKDPRGAAASAPQAQQQLPLQRRRCDSSKLGHANSLSLSLSLFYLSIIFLHVPLLNSPSLPPSLPHSFPPRLPLTPRPAQHPLWESRCRPSPRQCPRAPPGPQAPKPQPQRLAQGLWRGQAIARHRSRSESCLTPIDGTAAPCLLLIPRCRHLSPRIKPSQVCCSI